MTHPSQTAIQATRPQRSKNRKQQIIEFALELLQTRGFENFSYQDLSLELGITKASIHYHFPKKEDLGVALCAGIQHWHQTMFQEIMANDVPAIEKIRIYINGLLNYAMGNNKICPLSSLQADVTSLPPAMLPALRDLDNHELEFIANVLEQGRNNGELSFPGEAIHQAAIVVLSVKGALQYSRIHGPELLQPTLKQIEQLLQT